MNLPTFYRYLNIFKYYIYQLVNVRYYSVVDLVGRTGENGEKILIDSYYAYGLYPTSQGKSRYFVYSASQAKSGHDGVSVISDTVPWDGSQSTLADFHAGTGETSPGGSGAWVCKISEVDPFMAGAVGNASVNDTVAVQAALIHMVSQSVAFFLPAGTFLVSSLTITGRFNITGTGRLSVLKAATTSASLLTININTTTVNDVKIGNLKFLGVNSADTNHVAIRFTGDNTSFIQFGDYSNIWVEGFYAFVKDEKLPRTTVSGLEAMLNWSTWSNIHFNNVKQYLFWLTQGSGTGNVWNNIVGLMLDPLSATWFFDGNGCVAGDVIINGAHLGCRDTVSGSIGIKVGDNTTYRSNFSISNSQFDAHCDTPLLLSSVGSERYVNWKFYNCNGIDLSFPDIHYMSYSRSEDRYSDLRKVGRAIISDATGSATNTCFRIGMAANSAVNIEVLANGVVGGVGALSSRHIIAIKTDGVTMTSNIVESDIDTAGQLTITCVSVSASEANIRVTYNPLSSGTSFTVTGIASGEQYKITNNA
jgi:hypothetical protein